MSRAEAWERIRGLPKTSALALAAANSVPLLGVLFLGWSAGVVIFLYWLETLIVGLYHVPRVLLASSGGWRNHLAKPLEISVFIVQFGMMILVQGLIVVVLFNPGAEGLAGRAAATGTPGTPAPPEAWADYFGFADGEELTLEQLPLALLYTLIITGSYWALVGLFISHGVSFAVNYVGGGEFRRVSANDLRFSPFRRVAAMQVAVMIGGVFWLVLGRSIFVLLTLIVMKVALDLLAHERERAKLGPAAESAAP